MNFTYYYFCDCEARFTKAVHKREEDIILQCTRCFSIEAKEKKLVYYIRCLGCDNERELTGDVVFGEETCVSCGLKGSVGMNEADNVLFVLESNYHSIDPCIRGHQKAWKKELKDGVTCPYCFGQAKEKMSLLWEE